MGGELVPNPVISYDILFRRVTQVICGSMRDHVRALTDRFLSDSMSYEGFLVLLIWLWFYVARSKEICVTWHEVMIPMSRCYTTWGGVRRSVSPKNSLFLLLMGEQWWVFRGEDGPHTKSVIIKLSLGILIVPKGTGSTRSRIFLSINLMWYRIRASSFSLF